MNKHTLEGFIGFLRTTDIKQCKGLLRRTDNDTGEVSHCVLGALAAYMEPSFRLGPITDIKSDIKDFIFDNELTDINFFHLNDIEGYSFSDFADLLESRQKGK